MCKQLNIMLNVVKGCLVLVIFVVLVRFTKEDDTVPDVDLCGQNSFQDIRISGGQTADIEEYPWMAMVIFTFKNRAKKDFCGGFLINKNHVLTAAHCLNRRKDFQSITVRLGEYNTLTDEDCAYNGYQYRCIPPFVDILVKNFTVHDDYRPSSRHNHHDIAILELSADVPYTEYISPICIFKEVVPRRSQMAEVSGWGLTEHGAISNIKRKLEVPFVNFENCSQKYRGLGYNIRDDIQICAGGEEDKDACEKDSGGPLMLSEFDNDGEGRWYAIAIVSYGPLCKALTLGYPAVYTRISPYLPWIKKTIKGT